MQLQLRTLKCKNPFLRGLFHLGYNSFMSILSKLNVKSDCVIRDQISIKIE